MKVKTCLRFPGGKFYGAKKILPFLNTDHKEYREPMVGGGSIFLAKNPASHFNWINDKDAYLINFYKIIQNETTKNQLYELLKNEVANKKRHATIKEFEPKDNVEKAFKFFYLNRTSFSGIMVNPRWGYMLGSSVTPDRWLTIIEPVAEKLQDIRITNMDFKDVVNATSKFDNDEVLIYLDPPYFNAAKDIYNNQFTKDDHEKLADLLKNCKFKFVLSYDDNDDIKDLYNWAEIKQSNWTYFMSENRRQNGNELIITNYQIDQKLNLVNAS